MQKSITALLILLKGVIDMTGLERICYWQKNTGSACGSACGSGDKMTDKPSACGSACGSGDK